MNVIIVAKFLRGPRNFALRDPKVIAATGASLVLIVVFGFALGFFTRGLNATARAELAAMQTRLDQQDAALREDRKSTRLNSSPYCASRLPSYALHKKHHIFSVRCHY